MTKKIDPVLKILKGIRRRLSGKHRWIQGNWAVTRKGKTVPSCHSDAYCFCLDGAMAAAAKDATFYELDAVEGILMKIIDKRAKGFFTILEYNDHHRRRFSHIASLLEKAVAIREKELAA